MGSKVVTQIANMDEVKYKIIMLMGKNCEKYYFWGEICGKSDAFDGGGFSGAVVPDKAVNIAAFNGQANAVNGFFPTFISFGQIAYFQQLTQLLSDILWKDMPIRINSGICKVRSQND